MRQGQKVREKNGRPDVDLRKASLKYLTGGFSMVAKSCLRSFSREAIAWIGSNPLPQNSIKQKVFTSCFINLDVLRLKILEKVLAFFISLCYTIIVKREMNLIRVQSLSLLPCFPDGMEGQVPPRKNCLTTI